MNLTGRLAPAPAAQPASDRVGDVAVASPVSDNADRASQPPTDTQAAANPDGTHVDGTVAAGFAHVSVLDISRADAPATVVGDTVIGVDPAGTSFPIGFDVAIVGPITPGHSYAIRATIRDAAGRLQWTTDTVYPVDLGALSPAEATADATAAPGAAISAASTVPASASSALTTHDVGTLTVVAVGRQPSINDQRGDDSRANDLVGSWTVSKLDDLDPADGRPPVIVFAADGTVAGTTGCNRFTANWRMSNGKLAIGPAATTRRACVPVLDAQDAAMFVLLAAATAADVTLADDVLTIDTGGDGDDIHRLVARRTVDEFRADDVSVDDGS